MSFKTNWAILGSFALVMVPKPPELTVAVGLSQNFRFQFSPTGNVYPPASNFKVRSGFQCFVLPLAPERAGFVFPQNPKTLN